ncbi:MAG: 50S ribosomal protein L10 [Blastocatellia bacterium]|nr:50S ribosomal protein L10 [Blastocatellia bacterium]MBL8197262.1 50S ribosomal protein L10 [Blastocatellia bacterium]MBN8722348.1 50S ribosomal protein L10 [Acidobacteriota bacterium]
MDKKGKQEELDILKADFNKANNVFLVNFQGLTVANDTVLRSEMRKNNVKYKVVKNTLAQKAAIGTAMDALNKNFTGPTAIAVFDDPVTLAKLVSKFAKDYAQFSFKAGIVEGRAIDVKDLEALVNMPSKEQLLSKLMFLINSGAQRIASATSGVARNLAVVMGQIRDQKESQ